MGTFSDMYFLTCTKQGFASVGGEADGVRKTVSFEEFEAKRWPCKDASRPKWQISESSGDI